MQGSDHIRFSYTKLAWRILLFFSIFICLQIVWETLRDTAIENFVVHTLTIVPATYFINVLSTAAHAVATQASIVAPGGGLNILNGCEGLEALFLLSSAFAVAPMPWRIRVVGFVGGVFAVFVINQIRIIALFFAYRLDHHWFDILHSTVTPVIVVICIAAYFYSVLFVSRNAQPA